MTKLLAAIAAMLIAATPVWADDAQKPNPASSPVSKPRMIRLGTKLIPAAPAKSRCYRHRTQWEETPCASLDEISHLPHPAGNPAIYETPKPGFISPQASEAEFNVLQLAGRKDSGYQNDAFSLQLNTNQFIGANGHQYWVQFTLQSNIPKTPDYLCIWSIDTTTGDYGNNPNLPNYGATGCIKVDSVRQPGKGDDAAFSASVGSGSINFYATLPWATNPIADAPNTAPDAYSISMPDKFGLGSSANWHDIDGGFLGVGNQSKENFTATCVTTTLRWWFGEQGPTPGQFSGQGGTTEESNNLASVNSPYVSCRPDGSCLAEFDQVSADYSDGQAKCYPGDKPVPILKMTAQTPFEDDSTQMTFSGVQSHVCPGGALLIGLDARHNRFLCSSEFDLPVFTMAQLTVDTATHETFKWDGKDHSVHTCPKNNAMIGWNQSKDLLICVELPLSGFVPVGNFGSDDVNGPGGTQVPEPNHSGDMHACDPKGSGGPLAMRGIEAADNVFICMNSGTTPRLQ